MRHGRGWLLLAMLAAMRATAGDADAVLPATRVDGQVDAIAGQRFAAGQKLILERAEIAALGGLSVAEVLRRLPGLERAGDGMEVAAAGARGMARDAVQILVNGERPSASGRHALTVVGRLPAGELERIELVRGGSAEYGVSAEVVVNLVVRAPQARAAHSLRATAGMRGEEPNLQVVAGTDGGSGDMAWTLPVTVNRHRMPVAQVRMRGLPGAAAASERTEGDYRVDELILSPRLSWKSAGRRLSLWPSLYLNEGWCRQDVLDDGVPARLDRERGDVRIARLRADALMPVGEAGGRLGMRLAAMDGERGTRTRRTAAAGGAAIENRDRSEREFSGALRLDTPVATHLLSVAFEGGLLSRRELQEAGSAGALVRTRQTLREHSAALWVQDEWTFGGAGGEDFTLTSGVRADLLDQEAGSGWRSTRALAPSLAVRWALAPSWVVRTSAGGGLRAPRLDEIGPLVARSAGVNTPLEPDVGGRPGLAAERIVRFELGVERYLGDDRSLLGGNAYLRRTRNFIEREVAQEGGRWVERPANVGDALHWGFELSARLDAGALGGLLPAGDNLRASFTLPRARVDDARLGVRRVANDTPRHVTSLGYERAPGAAAPGYGVQIRHVAAVRTARAGELQGAHRGGTRIDAHVVRRLAPGVDLRLAAENLLGARDRSVRRAFHGGDAWTLSGRDGGERTWLLTLEGKW